MGNTGYRKRLWLWSGMCALALAAPVHAADQPPAAAKVAAGEPVAEREKVLVKARASYYSLHQAGLGGFKCSLVPNWERMLHDLFKTAPEGADETLKELKKIRFELSVSGSGIPAITHHVEGELDPELEKSLGDMYGGMEQMVDGFFATWRGFTIRPLLPGPAVEYRLEKTGHEYRISYREDDAEVVTVLGEDLAIKSLHVTSREIDTTLRPVFGKTAGGFLLSGYGAEYQNLQPPSRGVLTVKIDNRMVDGFQLPAKVFVTGEDDGTPFAIEIAFTDCHATRTAHQ